MKACFVTNEPPVGGASAPPVPAPLIEYLRLFGTKPEGSSSTQLKACSPVGSTTVIML
jgi:hypothetical protein